MTLQGYLLTPFFPGISRDVLVLSKRWVGLRQIDRQMLLIWWMKFSSSSIFIPKILTFDNVLFPFWSMFIIWLVWFAFTTKNTVILSNFLLWKFWNSTVSAWFWVNHPKLCRNCAFPWNYQTRKLSKMTVFFAVFPFIKDYRMKFTCIRNHVIIFKPVYCYLTFWFQNTNHILHSFSETWKSIIICKIMSQSK